MVSSVVSKVRRLRIVDAEQRRPQRPRPLEFSRVVDFDQDGQASVDRCLFELAQLSVVERGDDEQDAVRPHGPGLRHLVGVDHEVLAQDREFARRPRGLQVIGTSLKELDIGQHRQAGGTVGRITAGDRGRIEIGTQHTAARTGLLDLGDDRGPACRDARAQRADEVAGRGHADNTAFQHRSRDGGLRRGDLAALDRDNTFEDVAHVWGAASFRVSATKASSLRRAEPSVIRSSASATPASWPGAHPAV